MGNRIDGKACIVTGGTSGMGVGCAIEFGAQGGRVMVTGQNEDAGQRTVDAIREVGGEGAFFKCNLRRPEEIRALIDATVERFGGIDVLLNNAATHETSMTEHTSIEELPDDVWDAVYEVNLRGMWLATKYAVPWLRKSTLGAAIVNVGSTGSYVSYPQAGAYCATKGAVVMLTQAMAVDLAKYNIRCNCYCPGAVDTPMVQKYYESAPDKEAIMRTLTSAQLIRRFGRPDEIGKLACFLASEDSSFITGASYLIDGGTLAWRGSNS